MDHTGSAPWLEETRIFPEVLPFIAQALWNHVDPSYWGESLLPQFPMQFITPASSAHWSLQGAWKHGWHPRPAPSMWLHVSGVGPGRGGCLSAQMILLCGQHHKPLYECLVAVFPNTVILQVPNHSETACNVPSHWNRRMFSTTTQTPWICSRTWCHFFECSHLPDQTACGVGGGADGFPHPVHCGNQAVPRGEGETGQQPLTQQLVLLM